MPNPSEGPPDPRGPFPFGEQKAPRIGFIGAGRVGSALALALQALGSPVVAVASRSGQSARALAGLLPACRVASAEGVVAEAEVVFLTVPDRELPYLAGSIGWRPGQAVVHTGGAYGRGVLRPVQDMGALAGAFHPLQTFPEPVRTPEEALETLKGIAWAVEGDGWLDAFLEGLARSLGGWPLRVPEGFRPLYHASAVTACVLLASLLKASAEMWTAAGFPEEDALRALLPLARRTLENLGRRGFSGALTGPFTRGDGPTVERHLVALSRFAPHLLPVYRALARFLLQHLPESPEREAMEALLKAEGGERWPG